MWLLGRQFPDRSDFWDGNWLCVRLRAQASGSVVEADGPIVHAAELESIANELEQLDRSLVGNASLECIEPNLSISIQADARCAATATVKITPDQLTQSHEFIFSIDQSYFKPLIAQCRKILSDYPIKGTREQAR